MENVSHTLAGFVLARSGLDESTPLAATALVVGANLPDVDLAWSGFKSALVYFHYHRGWTHSLPGAAVLAAGLWIVLLGVDRLALARRSGTTGRARPLPLLAAA
ncbi:MAG TPA: metal-dependent hydrolase, partial [Candidatus Dormibacteraeota bacterium]|nr:metal-dependent hydrolase [Candidatus Dormibacteraeota bacterium]